MTKTGTSSKESKIKQIEKQLEENGEIKIVILTIYSMHPLSLFIMMTTEGWLEVMYSGIDATGIDKQPEKNHSPALALFFIAFMIIGSMLIFNLFVGVVIDNFNKIKTNEELGNMFVTESQKKWIEIQRIMMRKKLKMQEQVFLKIQLDFFVLNFLKTDGLNCS
jgi:hypothetical protein